MIWLFFGVFLTLFFATLLGELLSRRVNTERTRTVVDNLNARIRSWWWMCGVIVLAVLAGNTGAVVLFGLVSFLALREFITLTPTRQADHAVLCWCFFVFLPVLKSGGFDAFYQRTRSQIDSLVESDPTAFYTGKEYKEAADTLYETVQLRSQSISGQIEGSIPSTEEEQKNSDTLIDASHLDLSVMGSMSMGDRIQNWNENEKTEDSPFNGNESPENIASAQFEIDDGSHQAPKGGMGNMPNVNIDRNDLSKTALGNLSLYGVSFLAFIGVLVFAIAYHRRSRRFFR